MTIQELVSELGLQVFSAGSMDRNVTGGYTSDLLSCVMAKAQAGNVWVTLQAHPNVIAVASLLDLAGVIVSEGIKPDLETIGKAQENGVMLLGSSRTSYAVVCQLCELGICGGD